jgi:hypothetical protein
LPEISRCNKLLVGGSAIQSSTSAARMQHCTAPHRTARRSTALHQATGRSSTPHSAARGHMRGYC